MVKKSIAVFVFLSLIAWLFLYFNFTEKSKSVKEEITKECQAKRIEYDQQVIRKEYWNASFAMKRCALDLKNADYQQLADDAEVKARIVDIGDKTKNPNTRIQEIEILERFFPNEAKQFATLKISLIADRSKAEIAAAKALKAKKKSEGVSIGMSKEDVLASSWGKPDRVNTTTNAYGVSEQWVYGGRNYLYFENGKLTSIQN